MDSGRTLWDELCFRYYEGVEGVRKMQRTWDSLDGKIDEERFKHVQMLLKVQEKEAVWWRNACVLYFQHSLENRFMMDLKNRIKHVNIIKAWDSHMLPEFNFKNEAFHKE